MATDSPSVPRDALKIMPLGDSNTWGVGNPDLSQDPSTTVGYRKELKELLAARRIKTDFVGGLKTGYGVLADPQNEGWGGKGIEAILRRVREGLIETFQPDVLLLLIGSNDMWKSLDDRRPISGVKSRYWLWRLGRLLEEMSRRRPSMRIIVGKPGMPINAPRPLSIYRKGIDRLTARLRARGVRISAVDLEAENDGVHYTPVGYEEVARRWYAEIIRELHHSHNGPRCQEE